MVDMIEDRVRPAKEKNMTDKAQGNRRLAYGRLLSAALNKNWDLTTLLRTPTKPRTMQIRSLEDSLKRSFAEDFARVQSGELTVDQIFAVSAPVRLNMGASAPIQMPCLG